MENWIGVSGILWGSGVLFGLLALVPFIDRNPARHPKRRKIALSIGMFVLVASR